MKTSELTKAALLSALIALFALSFIYLPFFSFFGMFLGGCTVTILMVSVSSFKRIGIALAVALVLTALLSDAASMLYSGLLMVVLPGAVIGFCFRKKMQFQGIMLAGSLAYLAALMAGFMLSKAMFGMDLVGELKSMMEEVMQGMAAVMESVPELADQENAANFSQMLPNLVNTMMLMLPATLLMMAGIMSLGSALLSRGVLCRMGQPFSYLQSFSRLSAPKQISYGFLLLMLASLFMKNSTVYFLICNVMIVLAMILFVCGLSLLKYWINMIGAPQGVCLLLFCIALPFLLFLFQVIVFLGAADALWDFRKLRVAR